MLTAAVVQAIGRCRNTMPDRLDVAVVGAGPAGSWLAYRLARAGARVGLFDGSHPREKPCGGGVTRRAWRLVAPALTTAPPPAVSIESALFEQAGADRTLVRLSSMTGDEPALVVASRTDFDAALLRAATGAGAAWLPHRVRDLRAGAGGGRIASASGRVWHARWIVGADGANSFVRRRLFRPFRREQISIAAGFFALGATARDIVIRFVVDPPGYLWAFPRRDHVAIGICAQGHEAGTTQLRAAAADWIRDRGIPSELRPYAWPIPSLGRSDLERERPGGPGWLLAGDAAGLVDPITREGIFYALQSADLAADALVPDTGDAHVRYTRSLQREIYPELARAARLKADFFRPAFTRLLIEGLATNRRLRDVMIDLIAGEQSYRTLKRRLIGTFAGGILWKRLANRR